MNHVYNVTCFSGWLRFASWCS